ncbi:hypothetical protein EJB05_54203, partial [Eragrostis curvula]
MEDPVVPQPNAGEGAPTPSPPAGPPPRKKLKKDVRKPSAKLVAAGVVVCDSRRATILVSPPSAPSGSPSRRATRQTTREVITIEDNDSPEVAKKKNPLVKKTRASSSSTAPRPRSFEDRLNIVVSNLRPVADISSIERVPESNPSAATEPVIPSSSEAIREKVLEPEEGAVEDLGDGLGDDDSEDRPPTPPSKVINPAGIEATSPKTSPEEPEERDTTAVADDDLVEPKGATETEGSVPLPDSSVLAGNSPKGEKRGEEGENSQKSTEEPSLNQELPQPMEVDHRVLDETHRKEAVVASAEAGLIPPVTLPEPGTQDAGGSSSRIDNSSTLQKPLCDLDEDIRKQRQSESTNQTKFHYHYGGLLVSFQEMEKNLAAKEKMLQDLRPHRDRQVTMEEQIAALQAESREKDALIQKLQSAAGSSGDHERLKSKIRTLEDSVPKLPECWLREMNSSRIAKPSSRTKLSRKKTQLKEKEQLIAGLELALKNKGDELSASIMEKSVLLREHKKLELSAAEAIHFAFPSVKLKDEKSSAELLEMMPAALKDHCQFIAKMCSSTLLAKVKSHYPGLEESRLLTGYACERPEALALVEEVKATAAAMVADLNLDP